MERRVESRAHRGRKRLAHRARDGAVLQFHIRETGKTVPGVPRGLTGGDLYEQHRRRVRPR